MLKKVADVLLVVPIFFYSAGPLSADDEQKLGRDKLGWLVDVEVTEQSELVRDTPVPELGRDKLGWLVDVAATKQPELIRDTPVPELGRDKLGWLVDVEVIKQPELIRDTLVPELGRDKLGWLVDVEVAKQPEPLRETPVPVTVITSDMIESIGAKNLKQVLITYVPGMTSVEDHNEMNVAMRGVYASSQQKILILLNGHRLNSRSFSGANPDYSIGLDKIKRIEVLRGPGSSLYGNVALTSVINIITKKGKEVDGAEISAGAGNYGQRKLSLVLGSEHESGNDLLVWGTYYRSDGEKVDVPKAEDYSAEPKDSSAIVGGIDDPASYDIGINYEFGDFTLLASQRYSKYIEPFSSGGVTGESYEYSDYGKLRGIGSGQGSKFSKVGIDYNKVLDNGLNLQLQGYYDENEVHANLVNNPSQKGHLFLAWYDRDAGLIAQASRPYSSGSWMIGAQADTMKVYDSELISGTGEQWGNSVYFGGQRVLALGAEKIYSGFVQVKHRFSDELIANFGGRYDLKKRHKGEDVKDFSPRLALVYIPNEKYDVKLSYSESLVDAPYWYRYNSLPTYRGAESLKPEYLKSFQLTPTVKLAQGKFRSSFTFFYNDLTDFIFRNKKAGEDEPIYQNAGTLKSWGIENETGYYQDKYNIAANFTFQAADDAEKYNVSGHRIHNVPDWTANLILNYSLNKNVWFNFTARYIGKQLSPVDITIGDTPPFIEPDKEVDDVFLFNTGVRWSNIGKGFFVDARVYNLLDEEYFQGGSVEHPYPQTGRWYMLNFGYKGKW
ncbi:MAG: TonB-dependent receptor [Gammaproteobacteria bacterium]|nr:TonB-dependent receptor [Gammaproteobacteria bacterium]